MRTVQFDFHEADLDRLEQYDFEFYDECFHKVIALSMTGQRSFGAKAPSGYLTQNVWVKPFNTNQIANVSH